MTVHRSFTSTWLAYARGKVTGDDLTTPGTLLVFNCSRLHIYPEEDDGTVPCEVSWAAERGASHTSTPRMPSVELSADILEKWAEFRKVLDFADAGGHLIFRDDYKPFRVSIKGSWVSARNSAQEHGCDISPDVFLVHSEEGPRENQSTILTVNATLMVLGLWFNAEPMPLQGKPSPAGTLLFYSAEGPEDESADVPVTLLMVKSPPGHYPQEGHYPEDYIDCP